MAAPALIRKILPPRLVTLLRQVSTSWLDGYAVKTYSQEGEDMILRRLFDGVTNGFYIDVGAHHPKRFSNTYFLYRRGWRGINIEPNPEMIPLFNRYRPRDTNVCLGVSDEAGELTYFLFNEPALNSFDASLTAARQTNPEYHLIDTKRVRVERLETILSKNIQQGEDIDLMTVDVEGHDLNVLRSNDWKRFRPKCLLVEILNSSISDVLESLTHAYMIANEYVLFAKTVHTVFYLDDTAEHLSRSRI